MVTLTDARGCTATDTVLIHQPDLLEVSVVDSLTVYAYCVGVNTASLTSLATGGTMPYIYEWDDNLVAPQTTVSAINLLAGVYTITVTDARGCIATFTEDIDTVTSSMNLSVFSLNQYNGYGVSCFGSSDGAVGVTANSSAPYSYQWTGPSFASTNDTITNLLAGNYSVTVIDGNNCVENKLIQLLEPLPLMYTVLSATDALCLGACNGTITVDVSGGAEPYTGIATENTTAIAVPSLMSGDSLIPNMCTGSSTVSIEDANGCVATLLSGGNDQAVILATNSAITPIINVVNNVDCYGDNTGTLEVNNPDPNYLYSWETVLGVPVGTGLQAIDLYAGDYIVMAQFPNVTGSLPSQFGGPADTSAAAGEYSDYNGHLNIDCNAPSQLVSALVYAEVVNTITFELRDNTGSVLDDTTITVQVGEQRLYFDFDMPTASDLELGVSAGNTRLYRNNAGSGNVMAYPYNIGSSVTITSSVAGDQYYYFFYDLEVQEFSSDYVVGCDVPSQVATITESDAIQTTGSVTDVLCFGEDNGEISTNTTGGDTTSNYTYQWNPTQPAAATIDNLTVGTYTVSVTDINNCQGVDTFVVSQPANVLTTTITQNGYTLTANAVGGTTPYTYSWMEQSSSTPLQGGNTYIVSTAGTYYVDVTDENGCEVTSGTVLIEGTTGIVDNTPLKLKIYPNPFREETTIDFGRVVTQATISIVDVFGKQVELYTIANTAKYIINRNNKASGIYFMEVEVEGDKMINKLIIE